MTIYLLPSKADKLTTKAFEKGFKSRNCLVNAIINKWLEKEDRQTV